MALITITQLVELGRVSRPTVYKHIRAKKLTFKNGKADPLRLAAEWEKKRDPSQDDKIGPAIERVIGAFGLITKPDPKHGKAKPESEPEPPESEESYWAARTRHEKAKADQAELDLQKRIGELVETAEVEAKWTAIAYRFRDGVMGLGARVCNRLPAEWRRKASEVLTDEARKVLVALSDGIRSDRKAD